MLKQTPKPTLGLICCFCFTPIASAELHEDSLTEADLFSPVYQVQSVTGLKQRQSETPAATTIIDQALIRASGAINIIDVLRLVPGFQVYHVNANKFAVVSHGQGDQHPGRLEVMVDGRSVYLPLLSTVDWTALGIILDDIDHIEVVRGSNVPSQGSNAFLGSINIVTKEPFKRAKKRVKVTFGNNDLRQTQFQTSGRLGDIDYGLSGGLLHNHGFGDGYKTDDTAKTTPYDVDDGANIGQLSFRGSYAPTLNDSFDFSLGYSEGSTAVGTPHTPEGYGDRDFSSNYQSIKWQRIIDADTEFEVYAYHDYLKYDHTLFLTVPANALASLIGAHPAFDADVGYQDGISERFDISAQLSQQVNAKNRLIVGAGVRHEIIESEILFGQNHDKVDETFYRMSSHWEHSFNNQWIMNLGAMLEDSDIGSTRLSPRLGINYKLNDLNSFRWIISQAYRSPSLLEANEEFTYYLPDTPDFDPFAGATIDLVSRPYADLQPEKLQTAEFGYNWHAIDQQSALDIRVFHEKVTEAIEQYRNNTVSATEDPLDQVVREYRNESNWSTTGIEVQWRFVPWTDSWVHLAYGFAEAEGSYPQSVTKEFDAADFVPKHTLAAIWSQKIDNDSDFSLAWYSLSRQEWQSAEKIPDYNRIDLRYARSLQAAGSGPSAEIEFIIQNLFDDYTEYDVNNDMETKALLRLTMDF